jgi:hypothetical protein
MNSASFRIHSANLSPDAITARLGTQPSRSFEKGSLLSQRNPKSGGREAALWVLESSREDLPLSEQIRELLTFIEGKSIALTKLSADCLFDVFCAFAPSEGERMLIIEADLLHKFQVMPIDFVVDFLGEAE